MIGAFGSVGRETRLDNGVRVLTEWMNGVQSVAVGAWIGQGSAQEPSRLLGVSHLLEHMVFRGTVNRSGADIAKELEGVGGSLNAFTSREYTCYEAHVLAGHLDDATAVVADLVCNPLLTENDLDRERGVVIEEIAAVEDAPDDVVFELHGRRLWNGHPYGRSILGTRGTVEQISPANLSDLHRRTYVGANTVVAAAGRVFHDEFVMLVDASFCGLAKGGSTPSVPVPSPPKAGLDYVERDCAQAHIVVGRNTEGQAHRDRYPLIVLGTALGGGMSSRLYQRVREELGLAYTAYSFQDFFSRAGVTGVYVGTRPHRAHAALDAIRDVYSSLAAHGLAADELVRVREQAKGQVLLALEAPDARVHRLASSALAGLPLLSLDEIRDRIDCVRADDVARLAGDILNLDTQRVVCLGPVKPAAA